MTIEVPKTQLGSTIDQKVSEVVQRYSDHIEDPYLPTVSNPYETLLSMGELVDRLTIVNIKLYDLKNEVMKRKDDKDFLAVAALKDVALVEERSRLKRCIDEKIISMVCKPSYNPEIKSYGKDFND
jgi:hypothetical protein